MNVWTQALIDFGVLWGVSTFIALLYLVATNQFGTLAWMFAKSAISGAIGAGSGLAIVKKFGVGVALALAVLVSSGFIKKELLLGLLKKVLRIDDDGNNPPQ